MNSALALAFVFLHLSPACQRQAAEPPAKTGQLAAAAVALPRGTLLADIRAAVDAVTLDAPAREAIVKELERVGGYEEALLGPGVQLLDTYAKRFKDAQDRPLPETWRVRDQARPTLAAILDAGIPASIVMEKIEKTADVATKARIVQDVNNTVRRRHKWEKGVSDAVTKANLDAGKRLALQKLWSPTGTATGIETDTSLQTELLLWDVEAEKARDDKGRALVTRVRALMGIRRDAALQEKVEKTKGLLTKDEYKALVDTIDAMSDEDTSFSERLETLLGPKPPQQPASPPKPPPARAAPTDGAKGEGTIQAAIRTTLKLRDGAAPTPDQLASMTELDVHSQAITDSDLEWLARPDAGFKSLAKLDLRFTKITDVGLKALARADSGLIALASVDLGGTEIGDKGLAAMTEPGSGLRALRSLNLLATKVSDEGLAALARTDSGLNGLTSLTLGITKTTDAGIAAIARTNTALKTLTYLDIAQTTAGDQTLMAFSQPDSGLKALVTVRLGSTKVSDTGLAALARPDTGLRALATLELESTQITHEGLAALAAPNTGAKALVELKLGLTGVGDRGLAALAQPDSGLKALARLQLSSTSVSDRGLAELARPNSGLRALKTLYVVGSEVTDAGKKELERARPQLRVVR